MKILQEILVLLIRLYRVVVSPLLGPCCRFEPSCSEYAIQAVRKHGCFRGCLMAGGRICRCHPFNAGGYDPVPQPRGNEI